MLIFEEKKKKNATKSQSPTKSLYKEYICKRPVVFKKTAYNFISYSDY